MKFDFNRFQMEQPNKKYQQQEQDYVMSNEVRSYQDKLVWLICIRPDSVAFVTHPSKLFVWLKMSLTLVLLLLQFLGNSGSP